MKHRSNVKNATKIDDDPNPEIKEQYYNNIIQSELSNTNNIEINKSDEGRS